MESGISAFVVPAILIITAIAARPLVDFNILIYRKLHLRRMAGFWECRRNRWINVVRTNCVLAAFIFMVI